MKVYVLETDSYENRGVVGVYTTLETAMAAASGEWTQISEEPWPCWVNNRDWQYAASIQEFTLEGAA